MGVRKARAHQVSKHKRRTRRLLLHAVLCRRKVESALRGVEVGLECKCTGLVDLRSAQTRVGRLVVGEVLVHDVEALFVDVEVLVVLEIVDGHHAAALLDVERVGVGTIATGRLAVHLADLEDVLEAVERDLDDLVVHAGEQVAERLDASLRDEVADLLGLREAAAGGVADGPARLLLGLEVGVLEDVDEGRDDVGVDDGLDLLGGAGGDVGDGPAGLLADALLGRREEGEQGGQGAGRDDHLGLVVVAGDDVADGAEGGGLYGGGGVGEEVYEATADARLDDALDLFVGAVGEVGDGPAGVDEHLVVHRVDELGEDAEGGRDHGPIGLRVLAAAEVAEGPGGVAEHALLVVFGEECDEGTHGACLEDVVAALGAVACDVAERPDGLLADVEHGGGEELDEDGDGALGDDDLGVVGGAGGDVGERPGGLELDHGVRAAEELDEAGDDAGGDDALDGRVLLLGEQLAEFGGCVELTVEVVAHGVVDHPGQLVGELCVDGGGLGVVVVRVGAVGVVADVEVPALCHGLFALLATNLDLGLFTPATQLILLEDALCLVVVLSTRHIAKAGHCERWRRAVFGGVAVGASCVCLRAGEKG
ncbi:hypothetical protein L1887_53684 [Cichorium endivia]|nr:hypothetical protein L1887_53684 [Cichorium endivia]